MTRRENYYDEYLEWESQPPEVMLEVFIENDSFIRGGTLANSSKFSRFRARIRARFIQAKRFVQGDRK